ncbi:unnamed protein product [Schistosoma mattheei]|uniref:Uncharacterized protein n=1 Tax=Schistosoma mattheei TaxID=31246 RepID=A0A183PQ10_9TREM|nr:unnamed protein product [Schistosoma mattheei]
MYPVVSVIPKNLDYSGIDNLTEIRSVLNRICTAYVDHIDIATMIQTNLKQTECGKQWNRGHMFCPSWIYFQIVADINSGIRVHPDDESRTGQNCIPNPTLATSVPMVGAKL